MEYFNLPDLGEGLSEAEIVEWHVAADDDVKQDQNLVAVETAKAIVDLPSPRDGTIDKLYGEVGDIIHVGDPLVEYKSPETNKKDSASVVGKVEVGDTVVEERPVAASRQGAVGVKATPAVRALAARLNVDLSLVKPSGKNNTITADDARRVAKLLAEAGKMTPLQGVRRAMAQTMSMANAEVVPVTISDDADSDCWSANEDISIRLIRAIVAGCKAEPSLNAWYESHAMARILRDTIDVAIAIDTDQGLFVPVLRDVANRDKKDLRRGIDAIKNAVKKRAIAIEDMRGYTFTLSNFGTFAGRYANPIVVPPTVAILGSGKIRQQAVVSDKKIAAHNILPVSLTFDHRAVTGGEAARFLAAVLTDLQLPE